MTNNMALAGLMDFFGVRLGRWLRHPKRTSDTDASIFPFIFSFLLAVAAIISLLKQELLWFACLLSPAIVMFQLGLRSGYPQLVFSLCEHIFLGTKEPSVHCADPVAEDGRIWPNMFVADGGFYDFLGVTELLRRECRLIIVTDAGANRGPNTLESLADMVEQASAEFGIRFTDYDHETAIDFRRLGRDDKYTAPQSFIAIRVTYPSGVRGILFFVQMAITPTDPIEIQQIRMRFPSFPDEPITNQIYTEDQVAAFRNLGYHIGKKLCSHLQRWTCDEVRQSEPMLVGRRQRNPRGHDGTAPCWIRQPLFEELLLRLKRSYLQACYEEYQYSEDDVFGESIWRSSNDRDRYFPSYQTALDVGLELAQKLKNQQDAVGSSDSSVFSTMDVQNFWLNQFATNADVFSRYLEAVTWDVSRLSSDRGISACSILGAQMCNVDFDPGIGRADQGNPCLGDSESPDPRWVAHLTLVAVACQQLHKGVAHRIFQIGGRRKLCDLVHHLAKDLNQSCRKSTPCNGEGDDGILCLDHVAAAVVHEINEMNENVFQGDDTIAVISFVQCLCDELSSYKLIESDRKPAENPAEPSFDLRLDFRQLLHDKLSSGYVSHAQKLIHLYVSDPRDDDGVPLPIPFAECVQVTREIGQRLRFQSRPR